jgi:L-asparagine transporter-like permease
MSSIKVLAIILFILFGLAMILGIGAAPVGIDAYFIEGGPMPHGLWGVWMAVLMAIFSFIGIEMIAVASAETAEPAQAVPAAMRTMLWRLILFYGLGLGVMMAVVPWTKAGAKLVTESPFVLVFANFGLPFAASIMNGVVILAALSSMNALLYLSARMMFSLARNGQAPRVLGTLSSDGVPASAALVAGLGVGLACATAMISPAAYNYLLGIALFGAIWTWGTILATHISYRARRGGATGTLTAPFAPYAQYAALALLIAVLVTMGFDPDFWNVAIIVGVPWIIGLGLLHRIYWPKGSLP